ncbi:unnamed protein product [Miscanthus lutarioriparius]|uniref:Uncharacterized protein n=1 Tax=Miscanthus lutarioriparius TaxID=422564 RepID=A0A811QXY2_9POAL|nr:unnamed protein product [Miscanthus lutarioriparius]
MEEGGSGDVPPADPPRARPSTASRLVSGLSAAHAGLGAARLAEQRAALQGNGAGQGAGRQDGEQLQCRFHAVSEHRCSHCNSKQTEVLPLTWQWTDVSSLIYTVACCNVSHDLADAGIHGACRIAVARPCLGTHRCNGVAWRLARRHRRIRGKPTTSTLALLVCSLLTLGVACGGRCRDVRSDATEAPR